MDRLIVKNFGPLKDVDIELNKINLFIGENGSGKSVLGKIVTIVLDTVNNAKIDSSEIIQKFEEYNISFIKDETIVQYISGGSKIFSLKENIIQQELSNEIVDGLQQHTTNKEKLIDLTVKEKFEEVLKKLDEIKDKNSKIKSEKEKIRLEIENVYQEHTEKLEVLKKNHIKTELFIKKLTPKYIPAERSFVSLISKSLSSFIVADIPLPRFFLQFSSEFEKAGNKLKELKLLNVKYVNGDGLDRHKVYFNDKDYLPLNESSSGIQSALPLYLTVKYFTQKYSSIIIEEPEQNLFPKAQKETVEYIVEQLGDNNNLYMMTHSPYILTALNNLILANDIKNQKGIDFIDGIVKENQCVDFQDVSAYTLIDGKSIDIMDREDRIIGINLIDSISDEVNETFDKLLAKLD